MYRTQPQARRWWRGQSLPKDFAQTQHSPATRRPRRRQRHISSTYRFSSVQKRTGKTRHFNKCSTHSAGNTCAALRSEAAPVRRHAVIAMQFGFLRAIAPVEILVGTERRRALQLFIIDVEFVGFEL